MTNPIELHADADDQQLLAQVVDYYHRSLKASPEALAYLAGCGITSAPIIDQFRIGFADRTLGLKLPMKQLKAGKAIRSRLEKLGLFRASGHEHFTRPARRSMLMLASPRMRGRRWEPSCATLERIVADFQVVGERTNKLVGYLAAVSRKLDQPLAIIIQSSSAAGKTALMESVLSFVPPEDQVKYSALTGQSLFYMGETNLKHKILAIVEEEGAQKTSYALKLLQSEGELMIASKSVSSRVKIGPSRMAKTLQNSRPNRPWPRK